MKLYLYPRLGIPHPHYSINPLGAHNLYSSLRFIDNGDRFGKEMAVIKIKNVTE